MVEARLVTATRYTNGAGCSVRTKWSRTTRAEADFVSLSTTFYLTSVGSGMGSPGHERLRAKIGRGRTSFLSAVTLLADLSRYIVDVSIGYVTRGWSTWVARMQ